MAGVNAAAGGLIIAAVVMMIQANGWWHMAPGEVALPVVIAVAVFLLLRLTKLPAPLLVVAVLAAGLLL
jgi:hypothetical protein